MERVIRETAKNAAYLSMGRGLFDFSAFYFKSQNGGKNPDNGLQDSKKSWYNYCARIIPANLYNFIFGIGTKKKTLDSIQQ